MMEGRLPFTNLDRMFASTGFVGPRNKKTTKKAKHNMKTITKTAMYLQLAALCFATAFAASDLKEKDFSGSIASVETANFDPSTLTGQVDGSGTGIARHLGQFTYTYHFEVHVLSTGIAIGVGTAEFIAANGDSFSTEIAAESPGPDDIEEQHTIVGGSGRFAGASGSFTLSRAITQSSGNINWSAGTIVGTIVTPK
jgi:hypothetical protein